MAKGTSAVWRRLRGDGDPRLEPRLLKHWGSTARGIPCLNLFRPTGKEVHEPENISCNHSNVSHVRLSSFRLSPEFDIGHKRHRQNPCPKRLSREFRRLR